MSENTGKYIYAHRNEDGSVSQYVMPFTAEDKIVELGGGDTGIKSPNVTNVDIRDVEGVDIVRDLENDFSDIGTYDGLLAVYVAEHISWKRIDQFFKNCCDVLSDEGKAVFLVPDTLAQIKKVLEDEENIDDAASCLLFGGQGYPEDTHKVFFSQKRITQQLMDAGFDEVKIIDHPNPGAQDMIVEAYKHKKSGGDDMIKINFGSFTETFGHGWINCDLRADIKDHVEAKGHIFKHLDVRHRLPWEDNSVFLITAHHLIEHLTREEGAAFLGECYRIMKPGGTIRMTAPDILTIATAFVEGEIVERFKDENEGVSRAEDDDEALWEMAVPGHKTFYSKDGLGYKMQRTGFIKPNSNRLINSRSKILADETKDSYPNHSLIIECEKPGVDRGLAARIFGEQIGPIITVEGEEEPELKPYQKYLRGE